MEVVTGGKGRGADEKEGSGAEKEVVMRGKGRGSDEMEGSGDGGKEEEEMRREMLMRGKGIGGDEKGKELLVIWTLCLERLLGPCGGQTKRSVGFAALERVVNNAV
ncbi:hypothetical protein Pcinc_039716 [Petrolisthes cinctipes]|uniref:Uncharacterized protein n=1 Tax=Petrolisthes cinctipes TaxID=88211 RepID=A0AAE1BMW0_PETCI|nr:hypothetical protein Pcinc_039716 [Petrolisthes cinctipes]